MQCRLLLFTQTLIALYSTSIVLLKCSGRGGTLLRPASQAGHTADKRKHATKTTYGREGLANDGIFAGGKAKSSDDCVHTLRLGCMVHVLWQPQHCCIVQSFVYCQGLVQQVILQGTAM